MANTISIEGNLGRDSELRQDRNQKPFLTFSIGDETRRFNKDTNEWEKVGETRWWDCIIYGAQADNLAGFLVKGVTVVASGEASIGTFQRKDGGEGSSLRLNARKVSIVPRAERRTVAEQPQNDPWATAPKTTTQASNDEPPF